MANRIYLPPRREIYQGDIYRDFPGIYMEARPFRVARFFKATPERDIYGVHREDAEPSTNRFKWGFGQAGEEILARGHLGMAMVISHDCEIENDKNYRTLAMVRPITELQPEHRQNVFDFKVYSAFPLDGQAEEPQLTPSFVDFRRLTTVRPVVLASSDRIASVSEDLRKALAEWLWLYLCRPLEE